MKRVLFLALSGLLLLGLTVPAVAAGGSRMGGSMITLGASPRVFSPTIGVLFHGLPARVFPTLKGGILDADRFGTKDSDGLVNVPTPQHPTSARVVGVNGRTIRLDLGVFGIRQFTLLTSGPQPEFRLGSRLSFSMLSNDRGIILAPMDPSPK